MKCKLFLAISFLCHTSFFPVLFFYQLQKGNFQDSEKKYFLFFLRNSITFFLFSSPPPPIYFLFLFCAPVKLSLFFSHHFFFPFFPQEISPGCLDMKRYLSSLRPKAQPHAGCTAPIVVVHLRSMSTLLMGTAFPPRAHCSPSHHPHRRANSSHTGRWTGTCAPQSWDHALLHPPFQRWSLHLVPARRKREESKTEIN